MSYISQGLGVQDFTKHMMVKKLLSKIPKRFVWLNGNNSNLETNLKFLIRDRRYSDDRL